MLCVVDNDQYLIYLMDPVTVKVQSTLAIVSNRPRIDLLLSRISRAVLAFHRDN